MAKSLKAKVTSALQEAVGRDAQIELEVVPGGDIVGHVLSRTFARESGTERQDRIWKVLDRRLTRPERRRVTFIVTDTPREYAVLKKAAAE
jgi:hypothetical protein